MTRFVFIFAVICFCVTVSNAIPPPLPVCLLWSQSVNRRDDYTYTTGIGGHKVHTRAVPWNEARVTCEEEGGHLAIINSIAEGNAITDIFKNSEPIVGSPHPDFASIGFHDLYHEGQYITLHGQTLARAGFTQWAGGQPDNAGGNENCGSLHKSGGLNDINCGTRFGSNDSDYDFIGLHDLFHEGHYVTIHGQTLAKAGYEVWAVDEPGVLSDEEDCGSIYRDGKLNDIDCDEYYGFICKLNEPSVKVE